MLLLKYFAFMNKEYAYTYAFHVLQKLQPLKCKPLKISFTKYIASRSYSGHKLLLLFHSFIFLHYFSTHFLVLLLRISISAPPQPHYDYND